MLELLGVGKINIALYKIEYSPGPIWTAKYISKVIAIRIVNKASILIANVNKFCFFEHLKAYICRKSSIKKALRDIAKPMLLIG